MDNSNSIKTDIAIIGGGAGGLSVAAGCAQLGVSTVLIEESKMGGDCLNYGCIPSKSLLAAAKLAKECRNADRFGIHVSAPKVDFSKVMTHVQGVINTIAPHDSVERFTSLGVQVIQSAGHFIDRHTLIAGDYTIQARRFVIATGSSPAIPPIPGLDSTPFYTNETIFKLSEKPEHLIIIGGGPIGCELAQAFLLLGVKVTMLEAFNILPRDEEDLVALLREQLIADGLQLYEATKVQQITKLKQGISIQIEQQGQQSTIKGSHLLVATGRKPNMDELNLKAAGIEYTAKGIQVDNSLRTTNRHIFAMGDVDGSYQFTHVASYHAGIVIRNALFHWPAQVDYNAVPWVTYTSPELAHVGLSSIDALKQYPGAKILSADFAENDRAQTEHAGFGKIKVVTTVKGCILGVTILGPQAGELLLPWIIAIQEKRNLRHLTSAIVPYPTLSEISKSVAGEFYKPLLVSKRMQGLVRFLKWL